MRQQGSVLGSIVFSIIFIVAGWMAYKHIAKPLAEEANASEKWPVSVGTITYAGVSTSKSSEGTTMYAANVSYKYDVDGKTYSGSQIGMMDGSTSMASSVKKQIKKYAKGSNVDVYYDPELPSSAVLEPGQSFWISLMVYIPLSFCLVGALMLLKSFKRIFRLILT